MSQENVELVHRLVDAFNRRDIDSFLALCDPDIEYFSHLVELEGGGPYRGHDGIRIWWESLLAFSPDFGSEIEEVRDLGDVTVTRGRARGHGVGSDVPLEQTQWGVAEWREGKAVWGRRIRDGGRSPRSRRAVGIALSAAAPCPALPRSIQRPCPCRLLPIPPPATTPLATSLLPILSGAAFPRRESPCLANQRQMRRLCPCVAVCRGLTERLNESGRLDLNQRPLGPQPRDLGALCVPSRPPRPHRPRGGTIWTQWTMHPVLKWYQRRTGKASRLVNPGGIRLLQRPRV